ncbi:Mss4-like protein, partial [Mycena olivaceomarginata]
AKTGDITGGCNCEGVRYRVDFSPNHDWERGPLTCQCTQCRKMCGGLIYNLHIIQNSEITWLSKATYAEYNSSAQNFRAFCKNCGSSIGIELAVGTIDEEFLVGARDREDKPLGAYGVAWRIQKPPLLYQKRNTRVTDTVSRQGTRFWRASKEGAMKEKRTSSNYPA